MGHQVAGVSTLDRPFIVLSGNDPVGQQAIDAGKPIAAYVLPIREEIDKKLEFGGQIVHIYEDDTLYVFEVPWSVDLSPSFKKNEVVEVVGLQGNVFIRTTIRAITKRIISTSCGRKWTLDGKLIGAYGAYLDLQLRRRFD